jgi:hypothetical protein
MVPNASHAAYAALAYRYLMPLPLPLPLQTALKTLITLHRLMRETGPTFMEELVKYR